jgi:hypothetical protein
VKTDENQKKTRATGMMTRPKNASVAVKSWEMPLMLRSDDDGDSMFFDRKSEGDGSRWAKSARKSSMWMYADVHLVFSVAKLDRR